MIATVVHALRACVIWIGSVQLIGFMTIFTVGSIVYAADSPVSRVRPASMSAKNPILPPALWPYEREAIREGLYLLFERWDEVTLNIDEELVRHVSYFYKYYSIIDPHGTNRIIDRSRKYYPAIRKIFESHRLPEELAFAIPFVESAFVNKARSDKKAVGLFQFLKGTARAFDLTVSGQVDERMDYRKSASACAAYISKNRVLFDSTVLSIGSFHHGTSRLTRVLRRLPVKNDQRDFVSIFNHRRLGKYSKEYIPKCLAAALVFRFLKNMDMEAIPEIGTENRKLPRFVYVKDLEEKYPDLLRLNPDLQQAKTTYLYATTRGYLLVEELNYRPPEAPVLIARQEPSPAETASEETPAIEASEESAREPIVPEIELEPEPESHLVALNKTPPPGASPSPGPDQALPLEEILPDRSASMAALETEEAPPEELLPVKPAEETGTVPQLVGEAWQESIRNRFSKHEIVMNKSYTGVIEEIGIIFDQNLKVGEEWPENEILILEVGRPPIPEDELTSEEYTRFIQEYMTTLRQSNESF